MDRQETASWHKLFSWNFFTLSLLKERVGAE